MIGVLCDPSEGAAVREFFELFKTPWEFLVEGRDYDVILSTLCQGPAMAARLVVIYSSQTTSFDTVEGLIADRHAVHLCPLKIGNGIPVYGAVATLRGKGHPLIQLNLNNEPVAVRLANEDQTTIRVGYDLFEEMIFLLSRGQPSENALVPAVEQHISWLEEWIVDAGIPLVEIPPVPWGYRFMACLTHDVDFGGVRLHKFDHTLWGFIFRGIVGSVVSMLRGQGSLGRLVKNWLAVLSLPLVFWSILDDFWDDFAQYSEIEADLKSTYFLIPFKNRCGTHLAGEHPQRRATGYDIFDLKPQVDGLIQRGCEIGTHGIDAWHNIESGKKEKERIEGATGQASAGVRMHWLCFDSFSPQILDRAGFDYDSTCGYNETIGFRAGTTQVFRPLGVNHLLELPLHIQDTALFYPRRSALTSAGAWSVCQSILDPAEKWGGVVTVSWHQRSLAPERLWGDFYIRLLHELRQRGAWMGTADRIVRWFRQRRAVQFQECRWTAGNLQIRIAYGGRIAGEPLIVRVHLPRKAGSGAAATEPPYRDVPWGGESQLDIVLD